MNLPLPERISQARELAGLSKTELAEQVGVSLAAVSQWEDGRKNPSIENAAAISRVLMVPFQLLTKPIPDGLARRGPITFRALSASKTALRHRQAHRLAETVAELYNWLERWVSFPPSNLPKVSLHDPELAAMECRKAWGLEDRPIIKLGELLESNGIRLCSAEFGDVRFDAYSCIINGKPFAFIGTEKSDRARERFSVAHELGHLLLHQHYSDEELIEKAEETEKEAHLFAGAFLLPAATFSKDVIDTSIDGFKRLKPKWGVSIQAMVQRAKVLELISEETYKRHCRNISARGWRSARAEPLDDTVPFVNKTLGKSSLDLLKSNGVVKAWDIQSELYLPTNVLKSVFGSDFVSAPQLNIVGMRADRGLFEPPPDNSSLN